MKRPSISKKRNDSIFNKLKLLIGNGKAPIILIVIILLVLASIAYLFTVNTNINSNNSTIKQKNQNVSSIGHYEDNIISFDYPPGWKISQETVKPPLIVTVEKNLTNSFSVFSEELGNKNFVDRLKEWRETIDSQGDIYYERTLNVDGVTAYDVQSTYIVGTSTYSSRGIAIEKNRNAYFVIFVFDGPLIDYKEEMDLVIKSFHVK
ncbi:MAG: PsbP-related protein [Methanomicrobiales archaeon]